MVCLAIGWVIADCLILKFGRIGTDLKPGYINTIPTHRC